ncbi:D-amino acid dehydrogenase [Candidimonas nitroreducens]|uniref:Amino acid dehydrogenase n=1 Tax=Candidimonas nitroreducens TaxID=683354 RepID=A0A225M6D3_9BURK|nr:D-amino acid dehydrogenase [Candidimonas nitroreducens]OWT54519.1 amino acid dehydrogenase [Candidimonas nitroreducens]
MKILVLGAGVVGTATAYYLFRDGHEVEVVERLTGAGMETSFGNAGGLCPSFAGPWAAPGMPAKVLKMVMQADAPVRFSLRPELRRLSWARKWLRECNAPRFRVNKLRMQRVAHYSYACLQELMAQTPIAFDFHADGVLQLFQTDAECKLGNIAANALAELGIDHKMLDSEAALAIEPALKRASVAVAGALHLPADASGDSHAFCQALAAWLASQGVRFHYSTRVEQLLHTAGRVTGARTSAGPLNADVTVVAMGNQAPALVAPLGIKLPVYPLKGYSITATVTDAAQAPTVSVMDEHSKVMISRLGNRIRAAGMAELIGDDLSLKPERKKLLVRTVRGLFPDGIDYENASFWAGLRPMTPDGPPILGPSGREGLLLNSGHGSNGWTQACGTAKVVSDLASGRKPEIDIEGLTIERYRG